MTTEQARDEDWLTIGQLAERTGVRPSTLRMWEARYGFPTPRRLESGHRRYSSSLARQVEEVRRLKDSGTRLEAAIARASQAPRQPVSAAARSIYADLRRRHPALVPHQLRKTTLRGLSWAIEDEIRASVSTGYLFASFQEQRFYEAARPRWLELADYAQDAFVFADFPEASLERRLTSVPVPEHAPLRTEWAVVCDAPDFSVALSAWELPRQGRVRDRERVFESVWTIDPVAVRDAARVCARVACDADAPGSQEAADALATDAVPVPVDPSAVALYNRVVAYVDRENA